MVTVMVAWWCRAWLDKERFQAVEWLIPTTSDSDPTMPASPQQQFNLAVNLSTEMLRALKQNDGLQGPLKAHLYDGSDLVGAPRPAHGPDLPCAVRL